MLGTPSLHRAPSHRLPAKRLWLPLLIAVLIVATVGSASAYWRGAGDGAGGGTTGTAMPVVLSPGVPAEQLRPGGTTSAVLTMSNPNDVPITLDALALDTAQGEDGFGVDPGHAACTVASLGFTTQTAGWTVPPRVGATDGTLDVVLSGAVSMLVDAPDSCQGVHISVYLRGAS